MSYSLYYTYLLVVLRRHLRSSLFTYTTLFRSRPAFRAAPGGRQSAGHDLPRQARGRLKCGGHVQLCGRPTALKVTTGLTRKDRKSTRLNSSHANISYAVFCLKKKKQT